MASDEAPIGRPRRPRRSPSARGWPARATRGRPLSDRSGPARSRRASSRMSGLVGPQLGRVVAPRRGGPAPVSRAHAAPGPQARSRTSTAGDSVTSSVAGPSGVRVARQARRRSRRIAGSPRPRRSGPSVRRRSSGRAGRKRRLDRHRRRQTSPPTPRCNLPAPFRHGRRKGDRVYHPGLTCDATDWSRVWCSPPRSPWSPFPARPGPEPPAGPRLTQPERFQPVMLDAAHVGAVPYTNDTAMRSASVLETDSVLREPTLEERSSAQALSARRSTSPRRRPARSPSTRGVSTAMSRGTARVSMAIGRPAASS